MSDHQNTFWNSKSFLFIKIVECDAAQNCSSKGICGPDGACECEVGLYMDDCSSKL